MRRFSQSPRTEESESVGDLSAKPLRVLVVDDTEMIRELMALLVSEDPRFELVGEAGNGQEGIWAAERLEPDVVFLDVSMPVKTGLEAAPEIAELLPETTIVYLTGYLTTVVGPQAVGHVIDKRTPLDEVLERVYRLHLGEKE